MQKRIRYAILPVMASVLSGCTTIGVDLQSTYKEMDFGKEQELRICTFLDQEISEDDSKEMIKEIQEEFTKYNIKVTNPKIINWKRKGFFGDEILANFMIDVPLEAPCDRNMAFVGRNVGDAVLGILLMETLGAVDFATHTRGFVVAEMASINQLVSSPKSTAIHETYHFFCCEHSLSISDCYQQIKAIKKLAEENKLTGNDFFPGVSKIYEKRINLFTREASNSFASQVANYYLKQNNKTEN